MNESTRGASPNYSPTNAVLAAAPPQIPTRLICNLKAQKRIINELYSRFGGACYFCNCQLDINGTGFYAAQVIVHIPGNKHPRQLACSPCAPDTPTPPQSRRVFVKGGTLLPYIQRLFEQHDGRCVYCDEPVVTNQISGFLPNRATIDHVIPLSRRGSRKLCNLTLACSCCNGLKGNMTPLEFLRAICIVANRLDMTRS